MKLGGLRDDWGLLRPFLPVGSSWQMGGIGLTAFLGGLAESLVLVLLTLTADSLIREQSVITAGPFTLSQLQAVLLALSLVILRGVMTVGSSLTAARFCSRVLLKAQHGVVAAYLQTSHTARSARRVGDLSAGVINNGRFTAELANSYTSVATALCALVAFGGTSIVVNPVATLTIALLGGALLLVIRPLRRRSKRASEDFAASTRDLATEVTEVETLHCEIEVFRAGAPVGQALQESARAASDSYRHVRFFATLVPQAFQSTMLGAAVLSLVLVLSNPTAVDLASIGAVVLLLIRSMSAAQQLVTSFQRVTECAAYARTLNQTINELDETKVDFGEERPPSLLPLRLEGLRFTYDGSTQVLDGLDLELRPGDLVGVVGPSGAGKSTLVELLLRLRSPTGGMIRTGSTPSGRVAADEFARRAAFVSQHPTLITGTVAENVAFFRDIDDDRVRSALRQAHLLDEVEALPEGIHTRLGADDHALSGGQRQRLTIARALAGDPELVVLDEPTSALDAISEEAIRRTLDELREGRVVLVVAHRYSTLRSCSRILVLRHGRLEADASPEEVARHSEFFRSMVGEASR